MQQRAVSRRRAAFNVRVSIKDLSKPGKPVRESQGAVNELQAEPDLITPFLDRGQRNLRLITKLGELFSIRMTVRGRPIARFTHRFSYGELLRDAKRVLDPLIPVQPGPQYEAARWYFAHVRPSAAARTGSRAWSLARSIPRHGRRPRRRHARARSGSRR